MFGSSKKTEEVSSQNHYNSSSNSINSLVSGTKIEGKIITQSDLRIDGEIEGDIECNGRFIIGESGRVNGNISCHNAVVEGSFEGIIKVQDTLDIKEAGSVTGDVTTNKLMIAPGAVFNVNCDMGKKIKNLGKDKKADKAVS